MDGDRRPVTAAPVPAPGMAAGPRLLERLLGLSVALLCLALLLGGAAFALSARSSRLSAELILNYHLYHEDLGAAALIAAVLAGARLWLRAARGSPAPAVPGAVVEASWTVVLGVAAAAAALAFLGARRVFLGYGLSMDEFMADFDARIFGAGLPMAPVPAEWSPYLGALQPLYRLAQPGDAHWASTYLPLNAATRALAARAGDAALAPPAFAAAAVVMLYLVARRLFPGDRETQLVAVLLLATGAQFLMAAMTPYAMTAHLALNLAWLWLVLRDRPWSHAAAALVTLVACGLHQLAFHPLFAAPFLVSMLLQRRWGLVAYYAAVFAAAGLFWVSYPSLVLPAAAPAGGGGAPDGGGAHAGGALAFLRVAWETIAAARLASAPEAVIHVFRFLTWQDPLLPVLLLAAAATWRRWPPVAVALAAGVLLTLVFMSVLVPNPGHGRGYRYLHGLLGSAALLAAFGWRALRDRSRVPRAHLRAVLWVAVAASLLGLLPLRAAQTRALVRPYIAAGEAIRRSGADVVLVDRDGLWYGIDLVRNDPFLRARPLVMDLRALDEADLRRLCGGRHRVEVFDRSHPAAAGIRESTMAETWRDSSRQRAVLRSLGCGTPVAPADAAAAAAPHPEGTRP